MLFNSQVRCQICCAELKEVNHVLNKIKPNYLPLLGWEFSLSFGSLVC